MTEEEGTLYFDSLTEINWSQIHHELDRKGYFTIDKGTSVGLILIIKQGKSEPVSVDAGIIQIDMPMRCRIVDTSRSRHKLIGVVPSKRGNLSTLEEEKVYARGIMQDSGAVSLAIRKVREGMGNVQIQDISFTVRVDSYNSESGGNRSSNIR